MKHCGHCGTLLQATEWPRRCEACHQFNYNSPSPVVALVIPSWGPGDTAKYRGPGLLAIRRGIEPYKGGLAFPGGYIDHKETWQQAAVREAREELGVSLEARYFRIADVVSTDTNYLVLFVKYRGDVLTAKDWKDHDLTSTLSDRGHQEVEEIRVIRDKTIDLIVPSHNQFWKRHPLV